MVESEEYDNLPPDLEDVPDVAVPGYCQSARPNYMRAAEQLVSRGWDYLTLPVLDMLNHSNDIDKMYMLEITDPHEGRVVKAFVTRDVRKGEEITLSYSHSAAGYDWHTTPELMRDFGFVEFGRQDWHFGEYDDCFTIWTNDTVQYNEKETDDDELDDMIEFFRYQYDRVSQLKFEPEGMEPHEFDLLTNYHQALQRALNLTGSFMIDRKIQLLSGLKIGGNSTSAKEEKEEEDDEEEYEEEEEDEIHHVSGHSPEEMKISVSGPVM